MKVKSHKLNSLFLATAIAMGGAAVPTMAAAGATASVGVANIYLWRGTNLTPDGGQVHGGLELSHDMGLYGGVWTTSEEGGQETDLYIGFGNEVGGFSYDISFWEYLYPEDVNDAGSNDLTDNDASEIVVSLGFAGVSLSAYIDTDSDDKQDNNYFTIGYAYDKYSITYGMWDREFPDDAGNDEYSHLTFMYAATDEITLGVSKAFSDKDDGAGVEEDPLFYAAYDLSFDL